jgi:hypothetical protein
MALLITQTPASASLAQSPIIFTVAENTPVYTSSSFQYVGELYYWQGALTNSGSVPKYTITKYPNNASVGIFDLNRIINSTLTDLAQANTSNVMYYAVDFYWQYLSGSSTINSSRVRTSTYKALDGYGIFPEPIGQAINLKTPHWPLMTDGPATQSALIDNKGTIGVYVGTTGATQPTKLVYSGSTGNGEFALTSSTATSGQIQQAPQGPLQSGFPLPTSGLTYYTIQAYNSTTPLGTPIRFNVDCIQKYPNVRVKWKNRYGQFDYFNFYMVNRQSFSAERRTYQPQLGTWEGTSLSYQNYDSSTLNYIADSKQSISVNTFWLDDDYNNIFKQLLVSDEIYWITNETTGELKPITIATQNIQFKTGVVDKLVQYSFDFNFGQAYKLIM